jgi:excisionase family DNA binding protein
LSTIPFPCFYEITKAHKETFGKGKQMSKEELIGRILTATPEALANVEQALQGKHSEKATSLTTFSKVGAARKLGISRMTVFRLVESGKLSTIETNNGRQRITENELMRFIGEGK